MLSLQCRHCNAGIACQNNRIREYGSESALMAAWPDGSAAGSALRRTGFQRQGMELSAHFALVRLIDNLVQLDAGLAAQLLCDDGIGVMVAVASQISCRTHRCRSALAV